MDMENMNTGTYSEIDNSSASRKLIAEALNALNSVLLGNPRATRLALTCLLAKGHLLIEDIPGVGKTTLAHALAKVLGLKFSRIQFTSDLLPADLIGTTAYVRSHEKFVFHQGPLFSQVVLADEVNRATPRTQSALLEAMQERQITVNGRSRALPDPFFVIATENPADQIGVYALPESQLDRFAMRLKLGYPPQEAERYLYERDSSSTGLNAIVPVLDPKTVAAIQRRVMLVKTSAPLLDYVQEVVRWTRDTRRFRHGLSPRAGLMLMSLARAHAFIEGHSGVLPEDVQAVIPSCVEHRLQIRGTTNAESPDIGNEIISAVDIP